jgi:hypothetical protein
MQDNQRVILDIPTEPLTKGDISWSEYISSLSPEQLEKQREYDRSKSRKWYEKNKERKREKDRERREMVKQQRYLEMSEEERAAVKQKEPRRYNCIVCGSSYSFRTNKTRHEASQKHQNALEGIGEK